jgi:hypothetical protein
MDDKGYAFTPLAFLLMIPVVIVAVSYGNIVDELNMISAVIVGGDVTYTVAEDVTNGIQKSASDAGRNAAYQAVKQVIDNENNSATRSQPFLTDSRSYIRSVTVSNLNTNVVEIAKNLTNETGRQIYINNVLITPTTSDNISTLTTNDITIYQTDPFGFYVNVTAGINVTVTQNGQNFTFKTPAVSSYVSIEGLEDPYIWVNSKDRITQLIYKYPYYGSYYNTTSGGSNSEYHFADSWNSTGLYHLMECLNGTNNAGNITPNPYYFPDTNGMTFFDRLEGRTSDTAQGPSSAEMSTFIIGEPLSTYFNGAHISAVDHEYFTGVPGTSITVKGTTLLDPDYHTFYLSSRYFGIFSLSSTYT